MEAGQADSVSGYFTELAEREPDWDDARIALDQLIDGAGGVSDEGHRWARSVLEP